MPKHSPAVQDPVGVIGLGLLGSTLAERLQKAGYAPLSALHERLLQSLVDRGYGDEDNSAIIRAFYPSANRREIGP